MTKRLPICFIAFLWISCMSPAYAVESITLANGEYPPIFSKYLERSGIGSQIVCEAFALEGIAVTYDFMPWERALAMTRSGFYDGTIGFRTNMERETLYYVSTPVFHIETVVFHRTDRALDIHELADLGAMTLGVTNGYLAIQLLQPVVEQHGGKLDIALSDFANMKKLIAGRVDAFPCVKRVGLYLLQTQFPANESQQITYHPKSFFENNLHVFFSKATPKGEIYQKAFDQGLKKLKENGRYATLIQEYTMNNNANSKSPPKNQK